MHGVGEGLLPHPCHALLFRVPSSVWRLAAGLGASRSAFVRRDQTAPSSVMSKPREGTVVANAEK